MAIEKNNFKVSRLDSEISPHSRETMSSDEDELQRHNSALESDDDDEFDDADSGAGSDDFDLLELGETGAEFCQIGNQTCSIPLDLYDLPGLEEILSVDVWNERLSEEERFELAKYLPDMDQEDFVRTLMDLFTGCNLHFGSPIKKLFEMLKGGFCEPRVALYKEGLNFIQKRQHYHLLRKHQNNMVSNLCQIRDAWLNCRGYSIEERLRVLNIMRSQKSLMYEKMEDLEVDSSDEESGEGLWSRKNKDRKTVQKMGRRSSHGVGSGIEFHPRGQTMAMEPDKYGKQNPKGTLRVAGLKTSTAKDPTGHLPSVYHGLDMTPGLNGSTIALPRQKSVGYDSGSIIRMRDQLRNGDSAEEMTYGLGVQRDRNALRSNMTEKSGIMRVGKKQDFVRGDEVDTDNLMGLSLSSNADLHPYSRNANQFSAKTSSTRGSYDFSRKAKYPENVKQFVDDPVKSKLRGTQLPLKGNLDDFDDDPFDFRPIPRGESAIDSSARGSYDFSRKAKYPENVKQLVDDPVKSKLRGTQLPLKGNLDDFYNDDPFDFRPIPRGESAIDSSARGSYDFSRKAKYPENVKQFVDDQVKSKLRGTQLPLKGNLDDPLDYDDNPFDFSAIPQVSDRHLPSDFRTKSFPEKIRGTFIQNGGQDMFALRGKRMLHRSEETESDSSEELNDDSRVTSLKSRVDPGKVKFVKKDLKGHGKTKSKKMGCFGEQPGVENVLSKRKQKGKMRHSGSLHNSAGKLLEESYPSGSEKLNDGDDDCRENYKFGKNGRIRQDPVESLDMLSSKAYSSELKKKGKGRIDFDHSIPRSKYLHDYIGDEEDDSHEARLLVDDNGVGQSRVRRKGKKHEGCKDGQFEKPEAQFLGSNSITKKRKVKDDPADLEGRDGDAHPLSNFQNDDSISLKRKSKKKLDIETGSSDMEISEPPVTDMGTAAEIELETKPQKKPFTLITPTVHTGFSFSIIHLLSAVRMAMVTPLAEDSLEVGKPREEQNTAEEGIANGVPSDEKIATNSELSGQLNTPSLTVQEIVDRVRSNPGDPCILETQEPLQDLVRGVLKIFSSKTAPLGAKGWKVLAVYQKSTRCWSWTGPVSHISSDHDSIEEVTSPEAWGLPHKMLVKLVDSFANWLKCGQETLQQIGSLPAPPLALMQVNLDEKERFRDLRAQKSLNTISPSSEEVRAYFRKEEVLRYSIPDRAFSYTAADGKKSIVAPLRRCGGKPTSKARDHFMLKRDRPPHVTILCLVRDAAARLPGSIGTRADVCTLIRDSQYIVEDVSDAQINQVVSGALDRLHYERDPCVQFDGERKLWVYLHREREEEDFEDDGTSSTKKWKRQKKDATDPSEQGAVTVAYHGTGEQSGYDLCSDLNVEPSGIEDDKGAELVSDDVRLNAEENVDVNQASEQGNTCQDNSMVWETLGLNHTRENKLCQENSKNEDFGDESFGGERRQSTCAWAQLSL
ncbi:Nuclear factor kappa-B-binding protein [Senna tora]|uniref:Nuclear factor kappa-B-binding protein n=1 Tax=Senna tora TaxID=362788 RepID=A0A834X934_9FABA|nr:Nuclear factor kappa-B-binding protein [Senna tora]